MGLFAARSISRPAPARADVTAFPLIQGLTTAVDDALLDEGEHSGGHDFAVYAKVLLPVEDTGSGEGHADTAPTNLDGIAILDQSDSHVTTHLPHGVIRIRD